MTCIPPHAAIEQSGVKKEKISRKPGTISNSNTKGLSGPLSHLAELYMHIFKDFFTKLIKFKQHTLQCSHCAVRKAARWVARYSFQHLCTYGDELVNFSLISLSFQPA